MDIQTLYNLFQATFQPDPNVRIQAELQLKQVNTRTLTLFCPAVCLNDFSVNLVFIVIDRDVLNKTATY